MARTKNTSRKTTTTKAPRVAKASKAPKAEGGAEAKKERKVHRWRPGTVALREIKKYQRSTELLLRKSPVQRVIREIAQTHKDDLRFKKSAILSVQEAVEQYMTELFADANLIAIHSQRVTVSPADLQLARRIRNDRV